MTDADMTQPPPGDDEVALVVPDEFGVLVRGSADVVESVIGQLLAGTDARSVSRSRVSPADAAALGLSVGAVAAAGGGEYVRLTADAAAKLHAFGPQMDGNAVWGFVRAADGQFAGNLSFTPVSLTAEQALAMQTAAVGLALRSAIREVERAVEDVAEKVDDLSRRMRARLEGDVIGTYRHLKDVADQTARRGRLLEADWDGVAGVRNELYRNLEALRAYVRGEMADVGLDLSVPARQKRFRRFVEDRGGVVDALRLILVTEQSLHLYEHLWLLRVRDRDPDHVASAVEDARSSLVTQQRHDAELVEAMVAAIDRARVVEALEVHHVLTKDSLDAAARRFHEQVVAFAQSSRMASPGDLDVMPQAGLSDTKVELHRRATVTSRVARELGASVVREGVERARGGGRRARGVVTRNRPEDDAQ